MAVFFIAVTVFILDQGTKYVVVNSMDFLESIPVIKNVFHITLIQNYGAAFGILPNMRVFFIVMTPPVLLLIIWFLRQVPRQQIFLRIGLALQLGGALGNFVDRVRWGYVIDFFDFRIWPIFNIADMAIVVGVSFLALDLFRMTGKKGL